jgi:hypothetical protein
MARPAAFGLLTAGLLLWLHTFQALGMLQFTPSVETQRTFTAWTSGLLAAPIIVMASALLIAITPHRIFSWLALLVTAIFAARVWENVEGYRIPTDTTLPFSGTPLPFAQWPFVYHHGWWVFGGVAVAAVAGAVYAARRGGPLRLLPLAVVVVVTVALIALAGELTFASMSFLRLRNWSIAVAVLSGGQVLLPARAGGQARVPILHRIVLLLVIVALTCVLHFSWTAIAAELPRNVSSPSW